MSIQKIDFAQIRHEKKPFTTLLNSVIQNLRNPIALGLWVYLSSLPEGWLVNKEHLRKHFGLGRDKLNSVLLYLHQNKLIEIGQERLSDGTMSKGYINVKCGYDFVKDCHFNEQSYPQKQPFTEKPLTVQPHTEKPAPGKSAPINKIRNTNKRKEREHARERRVPLSDSFEPNEDAKGLAARKGLDLLRVFSKFKAHARAEDWTRANWDAAFMKWLIDEKEIKNSKNNIQNVSNSFAKPNESRCTIKFWEPGNPDYDRANGIGIVQNGTETSRNNIRRDNLPQAAGNLLSRCSLG